MEDSKDSSAVGRAAGVTPRFSGCLSDHSAINADTGDFFVDRVLAAVLIEVSGSRAKSTHSVRTTAGGRHVSPSPSKLTFNRPNKFGISMLGFERLRG